MAAALDPDEVLCSSKGRDNFQRLARLLISGGTVLMREAFDIKCPPSNLSTILQNPATKKLLKAAKLTKPQRNCLYPSPGMFGKSTDFDITLLFRLLRTICGLAPPVTGWDALPASTDDSLEADLTRIKYYRNSLYGHVNENMEISDDEFLVYWREISEALVRIAGQISLAKAKEWKNAIDTFLKDPLTEEDKRHEQELRRWYQNDTEVKEYMEKVEFSIKHLIKEAQSFRKEVRGEAQDIKDELGRKVEFTGQEVQRLGQDIKDELGVKVESTAQEVLCLAQEVRREAQDIKDELGGKVESTVQEVQRLRQEFRDRLNVIGRHVSPAGVNIPMLMDCETIPDPHLRLETSGTVVIASQGTKPCGDEPVVPRTSKGKFENTQNTQAGSHEMVATKVKRKAVEPAATASLSQAGTSEAVEITLNQTIKIILVRSEVINRDDFHLEELSSKEDIPVEIMTEQGSSEVTNRHDYDSEELSSEEEIPEEIMTEQGSLEVTNRDDCHSEEFRPEEDIPEEIMIEHESSEVINQDDYHSEEFRSEEDIPEEIMIEHESSEVTNRDDYDSEVLSSEEEIPEEIVTEQGSSEVTNQDDYHSEEFHSEEEIPEEIMIEHESSEVINRDDYHSEEFRSEEDIPEEIMIEHESSEVTNRDDYHSEELGSEEDIPVEITAEDNHSEHSSREDDIPYEGDFEDDIYDVIIGAEVTAERETPDYASERDDIPEEIVTEGDASGNMVDNKNDIIADEVREESIFPADYLLEIDIVTENKDDENYEDNCTEAVEIIEEAIYENEGCLDDFAIECQRISMINIPDVFQ